MTTKITRQQETTREDFIKQYTEHVEQVDSIKADVLELAELQAKHPADVYIVADFKEGEVIPEIEQGDILLWKKGSRQYERYIGTVNSRKETKSRNLQLGESITGDHLVVPLKNSNLTIEDCVITIDRGSNRRSLSYPAKIINADQPFCVVHREHGNVTLPAGEYMSCVSLDPKSMTRMLD